MLWRHAGGILGHMWWNLKSHLALALDSDSFSNRKVVITQANYWEAHDIC